MPDARPINATCPDCRGPLSEVVENGVREYRCLVEHRFSDLALLHAHSDTQERALWSAVVALEEAVVIANEVASHQPLLASSLRQEAALKQSQADVVRGVLETLKPFTTD